MSGSQFQQFNEDLNKMLGSTLTVSTVFFFSKKYCGINTAHVTFTWNNCNPTHISEKSPQSLDMLCKQLLGLQSCPRH